MPYQMVIEAGTEDKVKAALLGAGLDERQAVIAISRMYAAGVNFAEIKFHSDRSLWIRTWISGFAVIVLYLVDGLVRHNWLQIPITLLCCVMFFYILDKSRDRRNKNKVSNGKR